MTDKATKRIRLSPEARREQLVGIAYELLISRPFDELTVEAVAAQAGVSRALIFHYFPTVRELRLAALGVAAENLVTALFEAVTAAGSGPDNRHARLAAGLDAFVRFIEQQPETFDALSAVAATDAQFAAIFQAVHTEAATLVHDRQAGSPTELDQMLICGWVSFVETVVRRWVADPAGVQRRDLLAALITGADALIL